MEESGADFDPDAEVVHESESFRWLVALHNWFTNPTLPPKKVQTRDLNMT